DQVQVSRSLICLEDVDGTVLRLVIGRDHEVDPLIQVEGDVGVRKLRLVTGPQRHDELHGAATVTRGCRDCRSDYAEPDSAAILPPAGNSALSRSRRAFPRR